MDPAGVAGALERVQLTEGGETGGAAEGGDGGELARRIKALKKKIKAIEKLETDVLSGKTGESGRQVFLSEDQEQKLRRKPELVAQLAQLEAESAAQS